MTTDRELLELAAKAVGVYLVWNGDFPHQVFERWSGNPEEMPDYDHEPWNPLTDDGDALRLAVKLDIPISPESCNGTVWICRGELQIFEALGGDGNAAVRRAIVRAAAEIGRAMVPHRCQYCEDKLCGGTGVFTQYGQNRPCDGIPF